MKCQNIREKLVFYIDRELGPEDLLGIDEHLQVCAECRKDQAMLEQAQQKLGLLPNKEPGPGFEAGLYARLEQAKQNRVILPFGFKKIFVPFPAVLSAAVLLAVLIGGSAGLVSSSAAKKSQLQEQSYFRSLELPGRVQDQGQITDTYAQLLESK